MAQWESSVGILKVAEVAFLFETDYTYYIKFGGMRLKHRRMPMSEYLPNRVVSHSPVPLTINGERLTGDRQKIANSSPAAGRCDWYWLRTCNSPSSSTAAQEFCQQVYFVFETCWHNAMVLHIWFAVPLQNVNEFGGWRAAFVAHLFVCWLKVESALMG